MTTLQIANMRISGSNSAYINNQLKTFARNLDSKLFASVSIGRQDIRGGFSIALGSHDYRQSQQRHFDSKDQMVGYIMGCNMVHSRRKNSPMTDLTF
jgi:hypothetical protein